MEAVVASIVSGIVAGALAKAEKIGGQAILDAYDGLKAGIISLFGGKSGNVQTVEEEPSDEGAQDRLVEKLASEAANPANEAKLAELKRQAEDLERALAKIAPQGAQEAGSIDVTDVVAKTKLRVARLFASGSVKLNKLRGGEVNISDIHAGSGQGATPASQKKT